MKKVLIITYYWPPMGGGGVQRWLKTTKYIREYGWEPIIFTPENGEISILDEEMVKEIPKGVKEIRTPIWEPFNIYKKLTGKKKDEKMAPGIASESKGNSFLQNLSVFIRGNFFIPDARKFWIKPASNYLINYLKENKIDAIVSTGPPHSTHMIALNVVKKHPIPWLADFRDPWTNIDFYHKLKLTNWADKKHHQLEQEVIDTANQMVTVSWSWAEDFHKMNGRMPMVITNGFDPADFTKAGTVDLDKKFTITHIGSLNEDRNPHALWVALNELGKEEKDFLTDLKIQFIGQVDTTTIDAINKNGLKNNLVELGSMNHKAAIKKMIRSQLLLLPLNDTPNIDGVVPGKLYEYIGAKRPIICIGKIDGDSGKIIKETNAGTISDFKDIPSLKHYLLDYYHQYKKNKLTVLSEGYEKYSRKLLAGQIAEELNKISN
jgi:glycosyltransferase involved in cell wall biosynthesis